MGYVPLVEQDVGNVPLIEQGVGNVPLIEQDIEVCSIHTDGSKN